ncbi:hypothetical protein UY3_00761 [Chelonia mydas]|uniref:Uncharacterized protein n=1 Tax=Chelonia mydas TaxID=8469 RepID=M7CB51_CHEMY|nr:hypothetical protein UY3_00761 [Chelonia mydas]
MGMHETGNATDCQQNCISAVSWSTGVNRRALCGRFSRSSLDSLNRPPLHRSQQRRSLSPLNCCRRRKPQQREDRQSCRRIAAGRRRKLPQQEEQRSCCRIATVGHGLPPHSKCRPKHLLGKLVPGASPVRGGQAYSDPLILGL